MDDDFIDRIMYLESPTFKEIFILVDNEHRNLNDHNCLTKGFNNMGKYVVLDNM